MAGENLKAFDQLKETTAGSLSPKEKADLNAINQNDIREARSKIENKTFVINGNTMTLKSIVENLKMNKSGDRATLFGKEIARGSELGAAIQVYALSHNKTIGPAVIDGKVGRGTVRGLELTQTDMKAEGKAKEVASQGEKIGMKDLATHVFTKEFNTLGSTKQFKDIGLLTSDGYLNFFTYAGNSVVNEKGDCTVRYKSKRDSNLRSVTIHINKDVNDKVDCLAIARDIKKKVDADESKVYKDKKENSVISGIDKYDVSKSKLSHKAKLYLNNTSITFNGTFNKNKLKFKPDGSLSFGGEFHLQKVTVDSLYANGKFDKARFDNYVNNTLSSFLDGMADKYFTNMLRNTTKDLKNSKITTGSIVSMSKKIAQAEAQLNYIQGLGISIPADVKKDLNNRKQVLEDINNYKEVSDGVDKELSKLEKRINEKMSPVEMKNIRVQVTSLVASLEKNTYRCKSKIVYDVYKKVKNGEKLYQSLINRAKKIRDKVV